jgi:hypothetical protein
MGWIFIDLTPRPPLHLERGRKALKIYIFDLTPTPPHLERGRKALKIYVI